MYISSVLYIVLLGLCLPALCLLSSCNSRQQSQKDAYYREYYQPKGSSTPQESVQLGH